MLPRHNRLPAFEVRRIMRHGIRYSAESVTCIYHIRRTSQGEITPVQCSPRFSFVVSVKVSKSAVIRNRVRRTLRESIHHLLPSVTETVDMVIIGTKKLMGLSQVEVQKRVSDLLSKARLMNHE